MRLDKFIANNSSLSRTDVKKNLKLKQVLLNGDIVTQGEIKINPQVDEVHLNQDKVEQPGKQYYMLHKPPGVVCSNTDSGHSTVLDLLDSVAPEQKSKLQIAGRLDLDATGLVLLTDDGQWNHKVTAPRSRCEKTYLVELEQIYDDSTGALFTNGMMLKGEKKITRPAKVEKISANKVYLTISEGRFHQVKRMFLHTNNKVIALHRERVGDIKLDPKLSPGEHRPLTPTEITSVTSQNSDMPNTAANTLATKS